MAPGLVTAESPKADVVLDRLDDPSIWPSRAGLSLSSSAASACSPSWGQPLARCDLSGRQPCSLRPAQNAWPGAVAAGLR